VSLRRFSCELTLYSSTLLLSPRSRTSRRRNVADKITYYAIIDESSSRDHPAGVLRRIGNDEGEIDEVFSRNLRWEFSPLLYSAEHGDLTNDFTEITEEEAEQVVARIRAQASDSE
jgi:hypothetical protein